MKVNTGQQLPKFLKEGAKLKINLNKETQEDEDGNTSFSYIQATINLSSKLSRDSIIEAIIRAKYPTYGSELAASFNGGEDLLEHTAWRQLAKSTADEIIEDYFHITRE